MQKGFVEDDERWIAKKATADLERAV